MSKAPRSPFLSISLAVGLGASLAVAAAGAALAADDPLVQRQALMDATAAAAALSGGMLKGEIPYDRTAAKSAITTLWAVSRNYGHLFPPGSDTGKTEASPNIWKDRAGFDRHLAKFTADVDKAKDVSGKDGPTDLDSFKTVMNPVLANCKSCHEDYRLTKK
ncbi:MAG: cytochrome c [Xanthomonadales bacterium]|nr:cytochrome c [Xanthomonadales bacterium]